MLEGRHPSFQFWGSKSGTESGRERSWKEPGTLLTSLKQLPQPYLKILLWEKNKTSIWLSTMASYFQPSEILTDTNVKLKKNESIRL